MPSVRFKVAVEPLENDTGFDVNGCDDVRFLISANAGMELGRISKIASGGELSRIMLAMKTVFSRNDTVETLIFDEIDTGVSGIAAQRVGEKLSDLSSGKQVLCITHLPQIAALGNKHFRVQKTETPSGTCTQMSLLSEAERINEIAQMLSGSNISDAARLQAQELLRQ